LEKSSNISEQHAFLGLPSNFNRTKQTYFSSQSLCSFFCDFAKGVKLCGLYSWKACNAL